MLSNKLKVSEQALKLKILADRQHRFNRMQQLYEKHQKLQVIIKCNICGDDKNILETNVLLSYFYCQVVKLVNVHQISYYDSYDGNYYIVEVEETASLALKSLLIDLEATPLGRFIDLDLYAGATQTISREVLGHGVRTCIICGQKASQCIRNMAHSVSEVLNVTTGIIRQNFVQMLSKCAIRALELEVNTHPKFGLVTRYSSGSHNDMDYDLFRKSIKALEPGLINYCFEGLMINEQSFKKLRMIGCEMETAMFKATSGVNTHKGTIFIYGFLLPAIVNVLYYNQGYLQVKAVVKFLAKDILSDFNNLASKEQLTYGEQLYIKYGMTSIRGEVYHGLDLVFKTYEKYRFETLNNELVITMLLEIMSKLDDSVILHHHDLAMLKTVKHRANIILQNKQDQPQLINEFTDWCIAKQISPGGSADMLSAVLTLFYVAENFSWSDKDVL